MPSFSSREKKRVSRGQIRQTKLQRSNSTRRTAKRRLIIGPPPPPPPRNLSSSTLFPSLLIDNPQSAALPLQRPCTPLSLQPPIELRDRTIMHQSALLLSQKQPRKAGRCKAYGGTNLRQPSTQHHSKKDSALTSDPAAQSRSPSRGA